jgi:hypothetical protein
MKFPVKLKKTHNRNKVAINALEDTYFTENAKSRNEQVKAMMIVFFNIRGIVMIDWVPQGQVVNQKRS